MQALFWHAEVPSLEASRRRPCRREPKVCLHSVSNVSSIRLHWVALRQVIIFKKKTNRNVTDDVEYYLTNSLMCNQLRTELGRIESNVDHAIQGMKKPTTIRQSPPLKVYSAPIYLHAWCPTLQGSEPCKVSLISC